MTDEGDRMSEAVDARLLAVNVGLSVPLSIKAASPPLTVQSAIRKSPVSTIERPADVEVRRLGLAGDEQADLSVHGGLDKAVYMFASEHYAWWRDRRGEADAADSERPLAFGALGENLTTIGLMERDLWVGDRVFIGEVELQVESPRNPCFKLNAVMGYSRAAKHMLISGYAGVYLSVISTGVISAGSSINVLPGRREVSISTMLLRRRERAYREA
jgi:MOSC domain-containing protein YiiM